MEVALAILTLASWFSAAALGIWCWMVRRQHLASDGPAAQPRPVPNDSRPIVELVICDLLDRDQVGRARYGSPLQAGNGRDALRDAYEEALDLSQYLRQEIEERAKAQRQNGAELAKDRLLAGAANVPAKAGGISRASTLPGVDHVDSMLRVTGRAPNVVRGDGSASLGRSSAESGVTLLALAAAAGLSAEAEEVREVSRVLAKPIGEFQRRNAVKNAAGFRAPRGRLPPPQHAHAFAEGRCGCGALACSRCGRVPLPPGKTHEALDVCEACEREVMADVEARRHQANDCAVQLAAGPDDQGTASASSAAQGRTAEIEATSTGRHQLATCQDALRKLIARVERVGGYADHQD